MPEGNAAMLSRRLSRRTSLPVLIRTTWQSGRAESRDGNSHQKPPSRNRAASRTERVTISCRSVSSQSPKLNRLAGAGAKNSVSTHFRSTEMNPRIPSGYCSRCHSVVVKWQLQSKKFFACACCGYCGGQGGVGHGAERIASLGLIPKIPVGIPDKKSFREQVPHKQTIAIEPDKITMSGSNPSASTPMSDEAVARPRK